MSAFINPHERIEVLEKECEDLNAEIRALQIALNFWMPGAPKDDIEINERVYQDSWLLVGDLEIPEKTAESLGWYTLRKSETEISK